MPTHHFQPDKYYAAFGTYEPVLEISSGDTVVTSTVDAGGRDGQGNHVANGPNPLIGPFYVRSAEPGDTLAVHFDEIQPSRSHGFSGANLAPGVVDPDFAMGFPKERRRAIWEFDFEAYCAILTKPVDQIGSVRLPLRPMLGCFGVAPAGGQAISAVTSGPYGGNMDYRRLGKGVTVYFPVFAEGGLLFFGDGHALQGDGEIVGTGIETSMDLTFSVEVIKGRSIAWPRAVTADHIITVGNARPLDQALQHATTEMVRWLVQIPPKGSHSTVLDTYGLEQLAAHILLGQCVEYEIGNVFDPAYTVACKLPMEILRQFSA